MRFPTKHAALFTSSAVMALPAIVDPGKAARAGPGRRRGGRGAVRPQCLITNSVANGTLLRTRPCDTTDHHQKRHSDF
ncbi:hypothetical protein ABIA35_002306 [Catenulispora sp. MAP12-49]|uniref:hypothetical protein n=1 Tax=Catenulispora sp. MAP12-49 TaxID=3156302 RepID=UPI003510E4C0